MPESSSILQNLLTTTTQVTTKLTENALELLKYQQSQLEKKLLQQELINANLYQSLIDSGYITNRIGSTSTTSNNLNILEMLKQRGILNNHNNNSINKNGITSSDSSNSVNGLASMLPLNDVFTGLSTVFEKFFGTKMWIYILLAFFIASIFLFIFCFCLYCFCCSKIGRTLCCLNCSSFLSLFKKNSKKKLAKDSDSNRLKCCI